jgi:tRNA pseudouridine38-40 synthase
VQAALESALEQVLGHPTRATAAGRTDAGVHADAQVVSLSTASAIPAAALASALAHALPSDVWVVDACEAPPGFDARRNATRRWYRYHVWRGDVPKAAWQGRCLAYSDPLNVPDMRRAAQTILGRHDFRGYASPPEGRSTVRTVFASDVLEQGPLLTYEVCADGFLTHMVRGIVGGLLWVGRGRWTAEQFASALTTTDRRDAGPNAPPVGLTLARIDY